MTVIIATTPTATVIGILNALGVMLGTDSHTDTASQILETIRTKFDANLEAGIDRSFLFLELCAPAEASAVQFTATMADVEAALNETLDVATSYGTFREIVGFLVMSGFDQHLTDNGADSSSLEPELIDICVRILSPHIDFVATAMMGRRQPELEALREAQRATERASLLASLAAVSPNNPKILTIFGGGDMSATAQTAAG